MVEFFNRSIFLLLLVISLTGSKLISQEDSTRTFYSWKLVNSKFNIEEVCVDTALSSFNEYNTIYNNAITNTFLGNIGQAARSNIFNDWQNAQLICIKPFLVYTFNPDNNIYFNTRKHFTNVSFFSNTDKIFSEQDIKILHTQNVNQYFNFGFRYRLLSSVGEFRNQSAIDNALSFFTSHRKGNNSVYATYNYNKFKIQDNGGILNDEYFAQQVDSGIPLLNIEQGLLGAQSVLVYSNLVITDEYRLTKASKDTLDVQRKHFASIMYNFEMNRYRKLYDDDITGFYSNYYYDDSLTTHDSTQLNLYHNTIKLKINGRGNAINTVFAIHNQVFDYNYAKNDTTNCSNGVSVNIFNDISRKLFLGIYSDYYFDGFKQNDLSLGINGKYRLEEKDSSFIKFQMSSELRKPLITENLFYSNNFIWDTTFKSSQRLRFNLSYSKMKWNFETGLNYNLVSNYVYFNEMAISAQYSKAISVVNIYAFKDFHLKPFHFRNRLNYQKSSNRRISVPEISIYQTTYIQFNLLKKLLTFQFGYSLRYFSSYYGYAYMPSTGVFYLQDNRKIGNYPYVDIYLNISLKRARFFLKYDHFNEGFIDRNYFMAYKYPMHGRKFKFGISWNFYD